MSTDLTRRHVLLVSGLGAVGLVSGVSAQPADGAAAASSPWTTFPRHDPKLIAEIVGKSHFDEKRVRELIGLHPSLVNASWDWGFGDWETPLGAASHVGQRAIAEFLIASGARIDLFAAAMLGYTEVVKAFVTASPGAQRLLGPHGITLLSHAKAGGDKAKDTFDYLNSLGDAGTDLEVKPISEAERKQYLGTYQFGTDDKDTFEIKLDSRGNLAFTAAGESTRIIHFLENHEFFPAGVHATRFTFDVGASPMTVTISAGPIVLIAKRTSL